MSSNANKTFVLILALLVGLSTLSPAQAAKRKTKAKPKAPVAAATADTTQAKPKAPGLSNILPEQEVKGTYKGKIQEDKPITAPKVDIYGIVDTYAGSGYIYDKELLTRADIVSTPPPSLSSTQLRSPWLRTIL